MVERHGCESLLRSAVFPDSLHRTHPPEKDSAAPSAGCLVGSLSLHVSHGTCLHPGLDLREGPAPWYCACLIAPLPVLYLLRSRKEP